MARLVLRKVANGDDIDEKPKKTLRKKGTSKNPPGVLALIVERSKRSGAKDNRRSVRNPWFPKNINNLVWVLCCIPLSKMFLELVKSWVEERKGRSIRVKNGDVEIEIKGGMSTRRINKLFELIRHHREEMQNDDIKIILPPGVDRSIPIKAEEKKKQSGR